jgi:hypothetical protein
MPILGMPLDAWILLLLSAGLGLGLEVAFLRAQSRHAVAAHDRDHHAGTSGHDAEDVT